MENQTIPTIHKSLTLTECGLGQRMSQVPLEHAGTNSHILPTTRPGEYTDGWRAHRSCTKTLPNISVSGMSKSSNQKQKMLKNWQVIMTIKMNVEVVIFMLRFQNAMRGNGTLKRVTISKLMSWKNFLFLQHSWLTYISQRIKKSTPS